MTWFMALLERESELQTLRDRLEEASRGRGSLIVIEGSAGIGKTRLLSAAQEFAAEAGWHVLLGQGAELSRDYAFGLVRQLFEPFLASIGSAARHEFLSGPAENAKHALGQIDADVKPIGDFAVLHSLYWLVTNLSSDQPLLISVDDLQWADGPTLRFLAFLQSRLAGLRLLIVAALRSGEHSEHTGLVDTIVSDLGSVSIRPEGLSHQAVRKLVTDTLGKVPGNEFVTTCHTATAGNPLLLNLLLTAAVEQDLAPVDANADRVHTMGSRAVAQHVAGQLNRLSSSAVAVAQALAVLGDDSHLMNLASASEVELMKVWDCVDQLRRAGLVRISDRDNGSFNMSVSFAHPLFRIAIYGELGRAKTISAHRRAAHILMTAHADAEKVAAHVLRLPTGSISGLSAVLRSAASDAVHRGSPENAHTYLARCLQEPLGEDVRLGVLLEAGRVAGLVDVKAAANYYEQAIELCTEPFSRARIARDLGKMWLFAGRHYDAIPLCAEAATWIPAEEVDLQRQLKNILFNAGLLEPGWPGMDALVAEVRALTPDSSVGGRSLDSIFSLYDGLMGDDRAIERAERAVSDGIPLDAAEGGARLTSALETLITADRVHAMNVLDEGVARAHEGGSIVTATWMLILRGLGWLCQGDLAEAAIDLKQVLRLEGNAQIHLVRPFISGFLSRVWIEQGHLDQAASLLHALMPSPLPSAGPWFFPLESKACLLRVQGKYEEALEVARQAQFSFELSYGFRNPAFVAWRSEAALCLHALDRDQEARQLAAEELELAVQWGAPRAHGRALWVNGLVLGGSSGIQLMTEAVKVLESSPARLEYAKALIELGTALHRAGHQDRVRAHLGLGLELAHQCGARPLEERALTELRAIGLRPRRPMMTGSQSLTPSERRIGELAASGLTNREIAQQLFVTVKTVEVHLSSVYRKLRITRRQELPQHLTASVSGPDTNNGGTI